MSNNSLLNLSNLGQSIWYDNISRELLDNGELERMIEEMQVTGLTSNPSIFDNAISKSSIYDAEIKGLKERGLNPDQVIEELAIQDIARAADLLRPVFDRTQGADGYVSIEVSPLLARDTKGTVEEAKRLFGRLERPNVMIKVPGTPEGLPAVRMLLEDGINVNITLLFSVENYLACAKTYIDALQTRATAGESVDSIRSVASFFVSRVDSIVDSKLDALGTPEAEALKGKFGVANSRVAYQRFKELFADAPFPSLQAKGALVQRPLWASTSTKNPEYRDVLYIEELIGPDTVNTIPHATLFAFQEHGNASLTIENDVEIAEGMKAELDRLGVNVDRCLEQLQTEGVKKFADSFEALRSAVIGKMEAV